MLRLWMSVLGMLLLSGCASVMQGDTQQVHVMVLCKDRVVPAACAAQNAKGVWYVQTPASVVVQKDMTALQIACKAPFFPEITAKVPSQLNGALAGNLLTGGLVGAGVEIYRSSGFAIPEIAAKVPSQLKSMPGTWLVGSLVGAGVDIYTGAGFAYNPDVRITYPSCQ